MISRSKLRVIARPEDGLRALADHAPKAEAFLEQTALRIQPTLGWLYGARRRVATVGIIVLTGWLFLHIMFGANGMVVYREKRAEFQDMNRQVEDLKKENQRVGDQIHALKTDPETIEKEAREQLHYAKDGEVIYVTPPPPAPANPISKTARK